MNYITLYSVSIEIYEFAFMIEKYGKKSNS